MTDSFYIDETAFPIPFRGKYAILNMGDTLRGVDGHTIIFSTLDFAKKKATEINKRKKKTKQKIKVLMATL